MKLSIKDLKAAEKGSMELPSQFSESFRPDLIKRAVQAIQSLTLTPYGADPRAGMRQSGELSRRRKNYRGSYGHGISRVPRKILTRRGTRFFWVGAVAPGTVGGRRAHAPKAQKLIAKSINTKERKKAIRCALSASMMKDVVASRGHAVPDSYPFILSNDVENVSKAKDLVSALKTLGFEAELERTKKKTTRAGKGTMRGRKYKKKTGPVLVVSKKCPLSKVKSLPGVDVVSVSELNTSILAPGTDAGRAVLFSEDAVKKMKEDNLFI